jgi:hypothetical protein
MGRNQNHKWNDQACDTQPVGLGAPGAIIGFTFLDGSSNLVGKTSGNRAGKIARSNRLTASKAKELEILGGGAAVSVSAGSRCCPSADGLAVANKLQSEAGVNIFDSSKADLAFGKWVSDDYSVGLEFDLWEDVVSPNKPQQKEQNAAGFDTVLLIEPNRLNHGQSGQNQARYGNYVARSRSVIHSQILSRQEANYVAG